MTTRDGRIHQWYPHQCCFPSILLHRWLSNGSLVHSSRHKLLDPWENALQEGELVRTVQPSSQHVYLLTDAGRVLRIGTCADVQDEDGNFVWEATARDVTPISAKGQLSVKRLLLSAHSSQGWVVVKQTSERIALSQGVAVASAGVSAQMGLSVNPTCTTALSGTDELVEFRHNSLEALEMVGKRCNFRSGDGLITLVGCGVSNTAFLTSKGAVFVSGLGQFTGLGLEPNVVVTEPTRVIALEGKPVTWVACGAAHTAVLTTTRKLYSWGHGQGPGGTDEPLCKVVESVTGVVSRVTCGPHCTIVFEARKVSEPCSATPCFSSSEQLTDTKARYTHKSEMLSITKARYAPRQQDSVDISEAQQAALRGRPRRRRHSVADLRAQCQQARAKREPPVPRRHSWDVRHAVDESKLMEVTLQAKRFLEARKLPSISPKGSPKLAPLAGAEGEMSEEVLCEDFEVLGRAMEHRGQHNNTSG
eukprot:TRINITY_DN1015_c0_g2_i9.p1 TRINITY_DN1015_c0_g2~~TRINITY_DN1015_c0_g2_i9.p1  ORF type:complete len:476 (+),score=53.80 TRINITY_DN1015_c0_g2_i9:507-1934(+)